MITIVPGCRRIAEPVRRPSSPWVPLARLISIISRYLPPPSVHLITRYYADYMVSFQNIILFQFTLTYLFFLLGIEFLGNHFGRE